MRKYSRNPGFTLIELLVVISIISVLVSILLPSLNKAKDLAKHAICMSNLKQIGLGMEMYQGEYGGYLPDAPGTTGLGNNGSGWITRLADGYVSSTSRLNKAREDAFFCPMDQTTKTDYNTMDVVGFSSFKALMDIGWYNPGTSTWYGYHRSKVPNNGKGYNTIAPDSARVPLLLEDIFPFGSGMITPPYDQFIDPTRNDPELSAPHGSKKRNALYNDSTVVTGYFAWNDPGYIGDKMNYRFTWPR